MTPLTIHGAHGLDVWAERDGDLFALTFADLVLIRDDVRETGVAYRAGHAFDESDVDALILALEGPQLDDCDRCEGPGLVPLEGRTVCPGCVRAYGDAEEVSA